MQPDVSDDIALSVEEARRYFRPIPSKQTVYRLVWSGKVRVLDNDGQIRIPLRELRKFFGKVTVYRSRRQKRETHKAGVTTTS